jgi:hypothetical protein
MVEVGIFLKKAGIVAAEKIQSQGIHQIPLLFIFLHSDPLSA